MDKEVIKDLPRTKIQSEFLKSINSNGESLGSQKVDDAQLFEKEYTAYLEKQFKKSLNVQLYIGKIFIVICLCVSLLL